MDNKPTFIGVPTTEPPPNNFPAPAVGQPYPPSPPAVDVISARFMKKMEKKERKKQRKEERMRMKKGSLFLCCSELEIDDEEGKEKFRQLFDGDRKKRVSMFICCSDIQVGTKKDGGKW